MKVILMMIGNRIERLWNYLGKPHSASLAFMVAGSVWFMIGSLYGLVSAIDLVAPDLFQNIPFLTFGRSRPVHVNAVLFGFVTSTLFGAGFYYLPALLRTKLWSERLGWLTFLFWNIGVTSAPITFGYGMSQGREYAELIWIFDIFIELALLMGLANLLMTLFRREENQLYVAVWYFIGTFLWTSGVYFIGNVMWNPPSGSLPGLVDSVVLWFYGHNLPGLLMTPLAVGAAYFIIPRVTRTPLFSHKLSLLGFWLLVVLYTHIGGHHTLQAPIPNWLKVVSVTHSVGMSLPVIIVLVNLWMTARGHGGALLKDPAGRMVIFGTIWYLVVSLQGSLQSTFFLQRVTHFNNWTVGHAHIAVLGFVGFIALGALWHILPMAARCRLYSQRLVNLQFGLLMFGLTGFFVVLTTAGLIQGHAWYNGETVYRVLHQISIYMILRAALGISIIVASGLGLYNIFMTLHRAEPPEGGVKEEDYAL